MKVSIVSKNGLVAVMMLTGILTACVKLEPVRIFRVETGQVSGIGERSCQAHGSIIDLGDKAVSEHGFCLSTQPGSTIHNSQQVKQLGAVSSTGSYSDTFTDLSPGTSYYIRAYLTNGDSTTYGAPVLFTTDEQSLTLPSVLTSAATSVTETSATVGGEVSSDGGAAVTERGIFFGTSTDPQSGGAKMTIGSGTGTFSTGLTGLTNDA